MAKTPRPTLRFVDRLVLLVAWLVTCGLVYLLGFYVGRGAEEHHPGTAERMVRLPVTSLPPPEGQKPREAKDFPSFYQTLPGVERLPETARAEASVTTLRATTIPASSTTSTTRPPAPP